MKPYYQDANTTILHGDCIEAMRSMPDDSIDSIVTDPPYGLGFMGKKWDSLPPGEEWARECLRVLKPGGHLIAFGGSRTWHRLAVAIEDAGFEIRDGVLWLYGSGFPKSHDISKAIGKMAGAEREVLGRAKGAGAKGPRSFGNGHNAEFDITTPATSEAQQWEGWGTALKPAYEPAVMARKPFIGTVAGNVLEYGTGAINIDACRIGIEDAEREVIDSRSGSNTKAEGWGFQPTGETFKSHTSGRWPANVLLDEHCAGVLDEQVPVARSSGHVNRSDSKNGDDGIQFISGTPHAIPGVNTYNDKGGASRFFKVAEADEHGAISPYFPREFDLDAPFKYSAKAPKTERPNVDGVLHPTVKPLAIMRWLIRLVTPPGGTVLDPFAGSGTTIEAALIEECNVIGIEQEAEYLPLIQCRVNRVTI